MNQNKKKWLDYISILAVIISFLILVVLNIFWGENWIDSDMAAEMIFSKLLAEEGKWISTENWYYSTEFRVLYTQLIMVPLHHICSDWRVIRIITNIIFYLLLLGSFHYVCKPLQIKKRVVNLCSLALLVPISEAVMTHVQMGNTYMSHIILIFLAFGIFLRLIHVTKEGNKIYRIILWSIFLMLSMILGVSGVRYLLDLYAPLVLTALFILIRSREFGQFRKEPVLEQLKNLLHSSKMRAVWISILSALTAAIGYLVNACYISKIYQFQTYDTTNFIMIHDGVFWERVQNALGELLQLFGYIENRGFLSARGVITMMSFVMLAVLGYVWKKNKEYAASKRESLCETEQKRIFTTTFAMVSFVLHIFVFVFTTSTMVDRYFIPIAIFFLIVLGIYMEWEPLAFDRVVVCVILGACLCIAGLKTYYSFVTHDKNAARYEVVSYLVEQGYSFGYASYWNSNITTELSNGEIEMANLWSIESLGDFKWSSKMDSYEPKDGKIFLLLSQDEKEAAETFGMLEQETVIFENDEYTVIHFDNQELFLKYREQK